MSDSSSSNNKSLEEYCNQLTLPTNKPVLALYRELEDLRVFENITTLEIDNPTLQRKLCNNILAIKHLLNSVRFIPFLFCYVVANQ